MPHLLALRCPFLSDSRRSLATPPFPAVPARAASSLAAVFLLAVFLSASAFPAFAADWAGRVETVDGVTHVWNPAEPADPDETIALEPAWALGGYSEADEEFFGVIRSALTDADGNVYLLDVQLMEVRVFDPDGNYLRTIGREGEGPGEFRRPRSLVFMPDGNLGVIQLMPGRVILLTPEGDPAGEFTLPEIEGGGMRLLFDAASSDGLIALLSRTQSFSEGHGSSTNLIASYDPEGNEVARHFESSYETDFANFVFDETKAGFISWDAAPGGDMFLVPKWGEYEIHRHAMSGEHKAVIHREYEHLMRTSEEKEEARSGYVIRGPVDPKIVVSDHHPDIVRLFPREDGTLWVLNSRGMREQPEGSLGIFDVYDAEGRFIRRVTLMGEGDPASDMYRFSGNRLFVLRHYREAFDSMVGGNGANADEDEVDEPEPMKVICYDLPS